MVKLKNSLTKVAADYPYMQDPLDLWGVSFKWDGKRYVAEIPEDEALEMVSANRVVLV
jgi:hypothetical protein